MSEVHAEKCGLFILILQNISKIKRNQIRIIMDGNNCNFVIK